MFFFRKIVLSMAIVQVCVMLASGLPGSLYGKESPPGETGKAAVTADESVQQNKSDKDEVEQGFPEKDYSDEDFKPQVEDESYAWLVIKTILILGLLIGGFYYFFRYVTRKAGVQVLGQDVAKVLSVIPLGQNKYLQIVDLAGKVLVLGVSDNSINLITEIDDRDEINRLRIMSQKSVPSKLRGGGFQDYLTKGISSVFDKVAGMRNKGSRQKSLFSEAGTGLDYLKEQRRRLQDLNGYDNDKE